MIKVMNLILPLGYTQEQLTRAVTKKLKIPKKDILKMEYFKKSLDARKKPKILVVLTLVLKLRDEKAVLKRFSADHHVQSYTHDTYTIPLYREGQTRPVIVGFGPAGIFAGYVLAKAGLKPLILERGQCVEQRQKAVQLFRQKGQLNPDSNVQFGEGGAGTFSDGKLNTGIKDARIQFILETFVHFGAPKEILYLAKPHIGTDLLAGLIRRMRNAIMELGGEIRFESCLKELVQCNRKLSAVRYEQNKTMHEILAEHCILAIGHSARDTFSMLHQCGVQMIQKNFAVGVRIEHPQSFINNAMYGREVTSSVLPAADYKISVHLPSGHSLYTFCMCPGGEVVAAASEHGRLVVNGMSCHARNGQNANSALLVGVTSKNFPDDSPLAGVAFQRQLEEAAFRAGGSNYDAPVCRVGDFLAGRDSRSLGSVEPTYRPGVTLASPEQYLPQFIVDTLRQGIPAMAHKIPGFDMPDAILTGVESRSSSPVRIVRDETCQSVSLAGLYPCGEGAGYAGGITSAAVDGVRCAEQVMQFFEKRE